MGMYALKISKQAPSGRLKEALAGKSVEIREASRVLRSTYFGNSHWVYEAKSTATADEIEVLASFPAIREGDAKEKMETLVLAATFGNKGGQFIGMDEKEAVRQTYKIAGIANGDEITEDQYPSTGPHKYTRDRTEEILPPPIQKVALPKGGEPQIGPDGQPTNPAPPERKELEEAMARMGLALKVFEASGVKPNGHA